MRKIGIIGGTFDPVHMGHLIAADQVLFYSKLDEIWFMPAYKPPHKLNMNISSFEHRVKMLESILILDERYKVCTIEKERSGPSYTFDTMKELVERYPQYSFNFIIGGDMIGNLDKWHHIKELMELVQFIGLDRIKYIEDNQTDLEKEILKKVIMIPMPQLEISSSLIREWVRMGRKLHYIVPGSVEKYIKENNLYENEN